MWSWPDVKILSNVDLSLAVPGGDERRRQDNNLGSNYNDDDDNDDANDDDDKMYNDYDQDEDYDDNEYDDDDNASRQPPCVWQPSSPHPGRCPPHRRTSRRPGGVGDGEILSNC